MEAVMADGGDDLLVVARLSNLVGGTGGGLKM